MFVKRLWHSKISHLILITLILNISFILLLKIQTY